MVHGRNRKAIVTTGGAGLQDLAKGGKGKMADFYKMDPADWDNGTARLTLEEEAAYLRIVNAIHKHRAPVPDVDRVLSGMFRVSTRKARSLRDALIEAGKLTVENGFIWNARARSDLVQRGFVSISRSESGAKGGRMSAEARANPLKTNEPEQAIASSREEKRREEKNSEANASDASVDFAKQLFDRGVAFLGRHGTQDKQARSVIGKWRKAYQDTDIFEAFAACSKEGIVDPVPWITAKLSGKGKANGTDKQQRKLDAFIAGSTGAPPVDRGPDLYPAIPLLARG